MKLFSKEKKQNIITLNFFDFIRFKYRDKNLSIKGVDAKDFCLWEKEIFPSEKFVLHEMTDISGVKTKYFKKYKCDIPASYVRSFENGICYTNEEDVYVSDDKVVLHYADKKRNDKIGYPKLDLSDVKKIKGKVAHLSLSSLENNYFHWQIECLGRLYLIKKSGITPDYYIVSNHTHFQKQFLELLGIAEDKIIPANNRQLIQADELIEPSLINNWEYINFRGWKHYQKKYLPSWIGNLYREEILPKIQNTEPKNIYISRQNAKYRKIINEDELIKILKEYNFTIVNLDEMNVIEQIALFKNAQIVIGIHGAGLANLLFCSQNVRVLELFPQFYHDLSYRILCKALNIKHECLIGKTGQTNVPPYQENVWIDPEKIQIFLNKNINE